MDNLSGGPFGLYVTTYFWFFIGVIGITKLIQVGNRLFIITLIVAAGVLAENLIFLGTFAIFSPDHQFSGDAAKIITIQVLWAIFTGSLFLVIFRNAHGRLDAGFKAFYTSGKASRGRFSNEYSIISILMADKYLKTADADWYRQRITGAMICVLAAFAVLMVRLIYLQVIRGEEYRMLSLNNRIRLQTIDPPRGLIFDRNGHVLVENRPSFDVNIILKDAGSVQKTINKLSGYLNVPPQDLMLKLNSSKGHFCL